MGLRLLRALLTVLLIFSPAAGRAQTVTHITLAALTPPDAATLYYALQQGLFAKAGLDVEVQPSESGAASLAALSGGSVQIAYANVLSVAQAHEHGVPVLLLAPGGNYDSRVPAATLLVRSDSQLRTPKDLSGKTVAVASLQGVMSIAIQAWMDKGGGNFAGVKFVEMPPSAMIAALEAKRVDVIVTYEPFQSAALAAGAKTLGKPYDAIAPDFLVTAYCTTAAWASANHDAALKFAQIMNTTSAYVNAHYYDLLPLISSFSKIPIETLRTMSRPGTIPPSLAKATLQPLIVAAAKYSQIQNAFPVKEIIVPGAP